MDRRVVHVRCYLVVGDNDLASAEPVMQFALLNPGNEEADTATALRTLAEHLETIALYGEGHRQCCEQQTSLEVNT